MEWNRRKKVLWRMPCLIMAAIALFWGIWYAIAGSVPETTAITTYLPSWTFQLPLSVSRLWTIPFTGLVALALIAIGTSPKIYNKDARSVGIIIGLIFGLVITITFILYDGLAPLVILMLFGAFTGLFAKLCGEADKPFDKIMAFGLIATLAIGMICGLFAGPIVGLIATLAIGLVAAVTFILFSRSFWCAIGRGFCAIGRWAIAR